MNCPNCGNQLNDNDRFCTSCGYKVEPAAEATADGQANFAPVNNAPNEGYAPEQPQYAPEQPQYASQGQYAPQQPQYAPEQPQYAPQGQYAPQQPQYAPEQPQYASQPQYAPEQPQYAPQGQYVPSQPQYAPQGQYAPQQPQYEPQGQYAPRGQYAPQGQYAPVFTQPVPKKKKSKKGIVLVSVLLVVAIIATLVAVNFRSLKGWAERKFSSPDKLVRSVEKNFTDDVIDPTVERLGSISERIKNDLKFSGKIELEIAPAAKSMLGTALSDISWLDNVVLDVNGRMTDGGIGESLALLLNDKEIASLEFFADLKDDLITVGLPGLAEKYVGVKLSELLSGGTEDLGLPYNFKPQLPEDVFSVENIKAFANALDADAIGNILRRYAETIFDHIGEAEKNDGELTTQGVTEKCTVLKYTVTEEGMTAAVKEIMTDLREASDVKELLKNVYDSGFGMDEFASFDEMYEKFKAGIDEGLSDLEDGSGEAGSSDDLIVEDYIGSDNSIIGRVLSAGNREVFRFAIAHDGDDFGISISVNGNEMLSGKGSDKGGKVNAEYSLSMKPGEELLTLEVKDFMWDGIGSNVIKGDIILKPTERLVGDSLGALGNALAVKMSFDTGKTSGKIDVSLQMAAQDLVTLKISYSDAPTKEVNIPDAASVIVVDPRDESALNKWASGIDLGELKSRLTAAGVPEDFLGDISDSVNVIPDDDDQDFDDGWEYDDDLDNFDDDIDDDIDDTNDYDDTDTLSPFTGSEADMVGSYKLVSMMDMDMKSLSEIYGEDVSDLIELELNGDHTGHIRSEEDETDLTWSLNGSQLTLTADGEDLICTVSDDGAIHMDLGDVEVVMAK